MVFAFVLFTAGHSYWACPAKIIGVVKPVKEQKR
jgi:hypothetical protein